MTVMPVSNPPYFDPLTLRNELTALWRESPDNIAQLRRLVLARLKQLRQTARSAAQRNLELTRDGLACAAGLSAFQDELVRLIYDFAVTHMYRAQNPSAQERMAVVATGGYGRGLLAPSSDIDLLFLLPYKQTAWGESIAETILYFLWDLGFKVGHATRTVDQTLKAANDDLITRTALLDMRLIHGDASLQRELSSRFAVQVVGGSQREFIAAKLEEREARLKRSGVSRYRVEPNIKEGKGGLRDLNMLHWFAAYLYPQSGKAETQLFTSDELALYHCCEAFLWRVRCHLHFLAGKAEERLSFDVQPEMARRLQYRARGNMLAVERFMKHYFLVAKDVGDLTRTINSTLELRQLKTVPSISDLIGSLPWGSRSKLAAATDFRIDNNRLNVKSPDVFARKPINLIRLFVEAERTNTLLHPEALRLARSSLRLVDDTLRRDPEANRLFVELLTSSEAPESVLRTMNETGVLGRFIPEFGKVVAMMQYNMYHHYTIDEHLIRAIGILSSIEKGALGSELPLSTDIVKNIQNRRALYVALLMHDVAKAEPGDHSLVGAAMTRRLCERFGFSPGECDTGAWLVEKHLVMSQTAQSRDITDPKTVRDFADIVQSPDRLKLLLLLTVADIRAVGPGIWNGWKGQLLRSLYYDTEPLLAGGHTRLPRHARIGAAQAALRDALSGWAKADVDRFIERQAPSYWMRTDVQRQLQHAALIKSMEASANPVAWDVRTDSFRSLTEVTLAARDNPRLLMLLAGACGAVNANIASAQIVTTRDGVALDTLTVQRAFQDDSEERERGERIAKLIADVMSGKRSAETLYSAKQRAKPQLKAFSIPPDVIVDNHASDEFTVVEVSALDRPGLLFDLARTLGELGVNTSSAHIATFGERALDVFYVLNRDGLKLTDQAATDAVKNRLLAAIG
jgi:[protein-PII] uridylyltransferase